MHKNIIINYISFVFSGIAGVLINIFIISVYDSTVLGTFNFFMAFLIILSQFSVGGLQFSVLKHNSNFMNKLGEVSSSITSALFLSMFYSCLMICLIYFLAPILNDIFRLENFYTSMYIVLPTIFFFSSNKILLMSLNGLNLMNYYAIFNFLRYFILLMLVILFYIFRIDTKYLVSVLFVSELILFCLLVFFIFYKVFEMKNPKIRWIKRHFFFGMKSMLGGALMEANTKIDILMIGAFLGYKAVGIYSFASMIAEGFAQVYTILKNNVDPLFGNAFFKKDINKINIIISEIRKKYLTYILIFAFLIIVFYKLVFIYIFNLDVTMIEESWKVLTLLIVLMSMASFYRPFIGLLNQINKPEKFSQIILISVLFNIIMNIFLIPIFGIFGAAISTGLVFILESYLIYKTSFITLRRVNY